MREIVTGILTAVKKGKYGVRAEIATADGRTFYCPIEELKNCVYKKLI